MKAIPLVESLSDIRVVETIIFYIIHIIFIYHEMNLWRNSQINLNKEINSKKNRPNAKNYQLIKRKKIQNHHESIIVKNSQQV